MTEYIYTDNTVVERTVLDKTTTYAALLAKKVRLIKAIALVRPKTEPDLEAMHLWNATYESEYKALIEEFRIVVKHIEEIYDLKLFIGL